MSAPMLLLLPTTCEEDISYPLFDSFVFPIKYFYLSNGFDKRLKTMDKCYARTYTTLHNAHNTDDKNTQDVNKAKLNTINYLHGI